jgi:hypothetical protein
LIAVLQYAVELFPDSINRGWYTRMAKDIPVRKIYATGRLIKEYKVFGRG